MRQYRKVQPGFTLIELMTAIAIMTIMIGVTLVYFGSTQRGENFLEATSKQFSSHVREVQNNALAGRQYNGNIACGYGLVQNAGADSYSQYVVFKTAGQDCALLPKSYNSSDASTVIVATHDMPASVTVSNTNDIFYLAPHAKMYTSGSTASGVSDMNFSDNGTTYHVCVYPSGEIKENKDTACS